MPVEVGGDDAEAVGVVVTVRVAVTGKGLANTTVTVVPTSTLPGSGSVWMTVPSACELSRKIVLTGSRSFESSSRASSWVLPLRSGRLTRPEAMTSVTTSPSAASLNCGGVALTTRSVT